MEAGAAQLARLDDGGFEAELGGPDGSHVATHAAAEDDYVVFVGRHGHTSGGRTGTKIQSIRSPDQLLARFLKDYPFQPATAFWRAYEIGHLAESPPPGGRGLDLGCGDGLLTRIILELIGAGELVGVDVDPDEARLAEGQGIYERVHVAPGDRVPEPDASFDWILSNSVLEHIEPLDPVLAEAARLLRPGGKFVFTVPAEPFHEFLRGPLRPGASRAAYLAALDRRLAHRAYLSESDWRDTLARHGLYLETASSYLTRRQTRRWETISRFTAGLLVALWGGRRRPIEIQRRLGVRKAGRRMSGWMASVLGRGLTLGVDAAGAGPGSCLLVYARKAASGS
ncbi:MAG: class I SAM-dependent methyltransferase [Chloroflexota bacterium]